MNQSITENEIKLLVGELALDNFFLKRELFALRAELEQIKEGLLVEGNPTQERKGENELGVINNGVSDNE